jgi:hypothetical protein
MYSMYFRTMHAKTPRKIKGVVRYTCTCVWCTLNWNTQPHRGVDNK